MISNSKPAMQRRLTMKKILRSGVLIVAVLMLGSVSPVCAQNRTNTSTGMTLAKAPLAVHGYDVVAYFTEGTPRVGRAAFTATYDGAAYRFVSEGNKKLFEDNPERYAPQFGGFCAFGVSVGAKFDGDPTLWRIVNNRLYFNLNPDIKAMWEKDIPGNVAKAEKNWTRIRDKAPAELK